MLFIYFLGAGCGNSSTDPEPEGELVIGLIQLTNEQVEFSHPDTVSSGESFPVTVVTYGNSCMANSPGKKTEVELEGLAATVIPYDFVSEPTGDVVCPDNQVPIDHTATIEFEAAGTAELTVRGRSQELDTLMSVEREIVVR